MQAEKPSIIRHLAESDIREVAVVHLASFPESALSGLGREAVERYYSWLLTGHHDCVALGAFTDDKLEGYLFGGVFRGALAGFIRRNVGYLAWRVCTRPWLLAGKTFRARIPSAARVLMRAPARTGGAPALAGRSFGILAIAVSPRQHRRGVGSQLMDRAQLLALALGFAGMHLTVNPGNAQAIGFYEHRGWKRGLGGDGRWSGLMTKPF